MAYRDLREFVKALEKAGELKRDSRGSGSGAGDYGSYAARWRGILGASRTAWGRRCCLRSRRVRECPLLINTFGSVKRMELAFEVDELDEVAARIRGFLENGDAAGTLRQDQDVAEAGGAGIVFSEEREGRAIARK